RPSSRKGAQPARTRSPSCVDILRGYPRAADPGPVRPGPAGSVCNLSPRGRPVPWSGCREGRDEMMGAVSDGRKPPMTYVIALPCVDVKDRACVDECPVDCIYEGNRMLYIQPDECVDCGACEPVCPVEAIYYEDDTPDQWAEYYKANVEFFDDLGAPGGAAKMGVIDKDHPLIDALPPQPNPLA